LLRDEWPISSLRGGAGFYASAAFLVLRARAARKSISQNGLTWDFRGMANEGSLSGFGSVAEKGHSYLAVDI